MMKKLDALVAGLMVVGMSFAWAAGCSSSSSNIVDPNTGGSGGSAGSGTGGTAGTGGTGGAGPTAGQACADLAAAECQKISQCNPWYLQKYFGDVDTCKMRYTSTSCSSYLGLANSSDTPSTYEACAAAITSANCQQWLDSDAVLNACLPTPGMLASGATCGTAAQCQTANCNFPSGGTCGTCGPQNGAGAQCTSDGQCSGNLFCISGQCGMPGGAGATCSSTAPCVNSLACAGGRCAIAAKAGEACSSTLPCDGHAGLTCRNSVCQNLQYVAKGQPCNPAQGRECGQSGFCKGSTSTADGTCLAFAADGAACDTTNGPICMPYARCASGFCKVYDPSACR
jgi:hypothetical protein